MFNDIGKKIKNWAKSMCWAGIIIDILVGIILLCIGFDSYDGEVMITWGLILIFVAPFFCPLILALIYGYGELIDKVCDIERNTRGNEIKSSIQNKAESERIDKIEKLRSQGLITEEEYRQAVSKEE